MATWQIVDESCNINFKQNGVSVGTYAKELITLEIVLAGEPLNDTTVDNVFVLHDGKYGIEIPYNDTTGGYVSAEALRSALVTLINTNPCSSGGGGGSGDIKSDGTVDFVAPETWDDGGAETVTISPDDITVTDGALSIVIAPSYGGIQVSAGANQTTIAASSIGLTDGTETIGMTNDGALAFTGTKIYAKKITLSSSNIQTGSTIPIVLIPAAGAGTAIYARHDTTAIINQAGSAITASIMNIQSLAGGSPHIQYDTNFLLSASPNLVKGDDAAGINKDDCILSNADLIVWFDSDNIGFNGTIDIYLEYSIITL